jgi:hypothetical protein
MFRVEKAAAVAQNAGRRYTDWLRLRAYSIYGKAKHGFVVTGLEDLTQQNDFNQIDSL